MERSEALGHIQKHASPPGRWVMMPRQDDRFVGSAGRVKARIRERRRRVLSVLGEAIAFTLLIGAFPPLRAMWTITGTLVALALVYLVMLARLKAKSRQRVVELPESELSVVRTHRSELAPRRAAVPRRAAAR